MDDHDHYILVVDDDPALRAAIEDLLSIEGFRVRTARHGEEALAVLRQQPGACLIFLDLMMPVMDGWEFRARQRDDATLASIPVCVVSAAGPRIRPEDLAGARILPKPVSPELLIETASALC
jgi:CheY-like chemotaxis protein